RLFIGKMLRPGLPFLGLRFVDQLDALVFQQHQELVELLGIDRVVGQVIVYLTERQIAFLLALLEQDLQARVDLFHPNPPRLIAPCLLSGKHRGSSRWCAAEAAAAARWPGHHRQRPAAGFGVLASRAPAGACGSLPGAAATEPAVPGSPDPFPASARRKPPGVGCPRVRTAGGPGPGPGRRPGADKAPRATFVTPDGGYRSRQFRPPRAGPGPGRPAAFPGAAARSVRPARLPPF